MARQNELGLNVGGEAAVAMVIKEWSRAFADADEILAVIDSVYVNHKGQSQSMKQPKVEGEEQFFRAVVERSGFPADSIGMVEAHGNGTTVGDQVEAEAISRVFKHEVPLPAARSNFGHAEGVSGLVSIVKTVACLQRGVIAPIYRYTVPPDSYPLNNLMPVVKTCHGTLGNAGLWSSIMDFLVPTVLSLCPKNKWIHDITSFAFRSSTWTLRF
jgi:acyl transferase domain-containing protein